MSHNREFKITDARKGAALPVRVVTRAAKTELAGTVDDEPIVRVRLQANSADDPAANEELLTFLAQQLGVARSKLMLVAGERDKDKIITVDDLSAQEIEAKLKL